MSRPVPPPPRVQHQISPHASDSYSTPSPADQACRCGAHLLATSLSLGYLKPTATHRDFRLLTTGSTTPPACSPRTGAASPLLWGAPLYHLFLSSSGPLPPWIGCVPLCGVPSPLRSSGSALKRGVHKNYFPALFPSAHSTWSFHWPLQMLPEACREQTHSSEALNVTPIPVTQSLTAKSKVPSF